MTVTAELVKELRDRTGAGMMECKKALLAANGDIDAAVENMRKAGSAQADKKAGRVAAEGVIVIKTSGDHKKAVMVEVNCETDFVGRDENFRKFAHHIAQRALEENISKLEDLMSMPYEKGQSATVEETRQSLVATLGENVQIRRVVLQQSEGIIATYCHGDRIGVLVGITSDNQDLGKDLAMHIAASRPRAVSPEDISQNVIEKEREIFIAQAQSSGKPSDIIEKMVEGRIKKFLSEETLLGQPFVKDPSKTIANLLSNANTKVTYFERFEVGEGIEKKSENFVDEVMAQVHGSK